MTLLVHPSIAVRPTAEDTVRAAAVTANRGRNDVLDFVKGSLVLFMVLYHWTNYFVVLDWDVYRYLRFLTPSFIFITGFLISQVYLAKYSPADPRLHKRLLVRGVKILALFTALNLVARLLITQDYDGTQLGVAAFFSDLYPIYVLGNGKAAFDVLVPISYFLLLSPVLLILSRTLRFSLLAAGIAAIAVTLGLYYLDDVRSLNLELVSIAIFGLGVGVLPLAQIEQAVRQPALLVIAYAGYLAAITRWNIPFPLQVIGVCLTLLLIYATGVRAGAEGWVQRRVIELGKYSLFAYILHIFLLQGLRRGLRGFGLEGSELAIPFALALVATVVGVSLLTIARNRSETADRAYRAIFA
jgi:peptidoglycan/LPS O-acetylase OafA/YrhL